MTLLRWPGTLIIFLALSIALFPLGVEAQQAPKVYHVPPSLDGLRVGLKALGYEEGKNLRLDFRNVADEATARTVALELARQQPDLLVAFENQTLRATHAATSEIPVVFLHVTDPVAAPSLRRLLVLTDPDDPGVPQFRRDVQQATGVLKIATTDRRVRNQADLEHAFATVSRGNTDGVFIASLNLRVKFHSLILRLASDRHLPVAGHRKEWVQQGALFSYTENIREVGRAAASRYVDKILKGTKPADLPVEAYERPELVINLKTAKALDLKIPRSLLQQADEVIQ